MDEQKRADTPESRQTPLPRKVLFLVKDFYGNFRELLIRSDLRALETFLGGLCVVWGIEQSRTISILATLIAAMGFSMIIGAVQNLYRWRIWGCRIGGGLWATITLSTVLSGEFVKGPTLMPVYFATGFYWLYDRLLSESPARKDRPKESSNVGGYERLDNPLDDAPDRHGEQHGYTENHRSAPGRP